MISIVLIGNNVVAQKFLAMSPKVYASVGKAMRKFSIDLQRHVMADKLSGQVLNRVTGTLRRSITQKIDDMGDGFVGTVGTNVKYARVHEFGGVVSVKTHLRRIKQAFGRELKEEKLVQVRAHTANYPERSFLRSALNDMTPEFKERMERAAKEGVK
jgi:phage gpG-like protein